MIQPLNAVLSNALTAAYSFIPLACAEYDDSLLFSGASSIALCYVLFPATLLHQLFFHLLSPHLAISLCTSQSCCSQIPVFYLKDNMQYSKSSLLHKSVFSVLRMFQNIATGIKPVEETLVRWQYSVFKSLALNGKSSKWCRHAVLSSLPFSRCARAADGATHTCPNSTVPKGSTYCGLIVSGKWISRLYC